MAPVKHQNIVFRVDASQSIGSGHVMRCVTLAGELRKLDYQIGFICQHTVGHLMELIKSEGYPVFDIRHGVQEYNQERSGAKTLSYDWESDCQETIKIIKEEFESVSWLIIDQYNLDYRWERELRPHARHIMVIDDLANRKHDCELLLDQNYHQNHKKYGSLIPKDCLQLLGPQYALLRPEFVEQRKTLRDRSGCIKRILVFFGGSDPVNETSKALEALQNLGRSDIKIDVIVGSTNPKQFEIKSSLERILGTALHVQVDNMAEFMTKSDLAIGAVGAVTWERFALGLPTIAAATAENQREVAESLFRDGLLHYVGTSDTTTPETYLEAIRFLISNSTSLKSYEQKGLDLVDTLGAERTIRKIKEVYGVS